MNKIKGVAFDMDGLMIDSERLTFKIFRSECKKMGYDCTEEIFKTLIGLRSADTGKRLKTLFGEDFDFETMYSNNKKTYIEYIQKNGVPVKDGLFKLLDYLKENKIKTAVATSTSFQTSSMILKTAGIYEYLDALVCGDMVQNGKPAPDIFIKACEMMGEDVSCCMGLEDSFNGLRAINAAGMTAVMVPDMLMPTKEVEETVYAVAENLSAVIGIIEQINKG